MRDYAGFSYASLLFGYGSLGLVMFRLYSLFRLCYYSWLCIVYYINDTILYKWYYLWIDLVLLIDDPCDRPSKLWYSHKPLLITDKKNSSVKQQSDLNIAIYEM